MPLRDNLNNKMFDALVFSFKKAIEIQPDLAEAHNNLGNTLRDNKKFSELSPQKKHKYWLKSKKNTRV